MEELLHGGERVGADLDVVERGTAVREAASSDAKGVRLTIGRKKCLVAGGGIEAFGRAFSRG
jgi:hypothetical protein